MRTSILGTIVSAAVGAFAFFGVASPAEAQSVVVIGVGEWGPGVTPVKGFRRRVRFLRSSWSFRIRFPLIQPTVPISIMFWTTRG